MHILKLGSCIRKRATSSRISDKIQSMLLVQFRAQQAAKKVSGTWGEESRRLIFILLKQTLQKKEGVDLTQKILQLP